MPARELMLELRTLTEKRELFMILNTFDYLRALTELANDGLPTKTVKSRHAYANVRPRKFRERDEFTDIWEGGREV